MKLKKIISHHILFGGILFLATYKLQANDAVLKVLYGIQNASEKILDKQIKSIYREDDSDLERSKKILQYLVTSNNYFVIQGIDFSNDVLRENKKPPLDYRKIPFDRYYQLFHRSILNDNDAFYSHRWISYTFLLEKYETEFTHRLIEDVRRSKTFKTKLFRHFKYRWLASYRKKDSNFRLMLKIEEGSKYKDPKRVEDAIANRLKEIDLENAESSYKNEMVRLKFYYALTLKKEKRIDWFIQNVKELITYTSYPTSMSPHVANYVTKLLIAEIRAGEYRDAKTLFYAYMDGMLPKIGISEKSSDVASNALVLGILSKDDKISKRVIATFAPNISQVNNVLLLYNLAAYYAIKKHKKEMLVAIKRSIKKGKNPKDFLKDSDFKRYWNDKAFLEALE